MALLVAARIVFPAEGDVFAIESQQAMIADSNTMGVPAQIAEHLAGAAESGFDIDDPVFPEQCTKKSRKCLGSSSAALAARKVQFLLAKARLGPP